jgi:subtilisin family serine protease
MRYRDLLLAVVLLLALLADGTTANRFGETEATVATQSALPGVRLRMPSTSRPLREQAVRATTVTASPAGTDLLLALPRAGLAAPALSTALTRLGYSAEPVSGLLDVVRVSVPAGADPAALAHTLAATGLLASVEPDVRVRAHRLPDDPLMISQQPYLEAIRAPLAWDTVTTAPAVTIAVVDTGVDATHPDLAGRVAVNAREVIDGRDEDGNGCIDDLRGCSFRVARRGRPVLRLHKHHPARRRRRR